MLLRGEEAGCGSQFFQAIDVGRIALSALPRHEVNDGLIRPVLQKFCSRLDESQRCS
jgi:hypothetical protein